MCGIFAYSGTEDAIATVIQGLKRLEYRGYDSWGIAAPLSGKVSSYKNLGPISAVNDNQVLPPAQAAVGHTRWATHGAVNLANCHPHVASDQSFAVVHNGIIENFQFLKAELQKQGVAFITDTDTEVLIRLIERRYKTGCPESFEHAVKGAFSQLKGRNTLIAFNSENRHIIAIKNGSPLIVGKRASVKSCRGRNPIIDPKGQDAQRQTLCDDYFFASDPLSFADYTDQTFTLDNGEMVSFCPGKPLQLQDVATGIAKTIVWESLKSQDSVADQKTAYDKGEYAHYMLKEICEQWITVSRAAQIPEKQRLSLVDRLKQAKSVYLIGAGGAYFTAEQIAYLFRRVARLPVVALPVYELTNYLPLMDTQDLVIAISQSGETADTLDAMEYCIAKGIYCAALVNAPRSSMARLTDNAIANRAGPEICVLSTKSATAQITAGYVLANEVANNASYLQAIDSLCQDLCNAFDTPYINHIRAIAKKLMHNHQIFILGRDSFYSIARIAALNIKEASYIHAEAFAAGELKHGVIAMIERGTPVLLYVDDNDAYMVNVAAELKARGATVIAVGYTTNPLFDTFIPLPISSKGEEKAIAGLIPGQLLAYYLALGKGLNPDRPRNLAKSVTVR